MEIDKCERSSALTEHHKECGEVLSYRIPFDDCVAIVFCPEHKEDMHFVFIRAYKKLGLDLQG
jgi:hypothetical protein